MRKNEETQFQINLFYKLSRLELERPGLFVYAVEFGGEERKDFGKIRELKAKGMRKGISDLTVIGNGRIVFLELKTGKGTQQQAQKIFQNKVEQNGFVYMLARSTEGVDATIQRVLGALGYQ
jgi:hypothetical protein